MGLGSLARGADPTAANPVTGWRGDGTGIYPAGEFPTEWGDHKNLIWTAHVGGAFSSPVVVDDRVFVSSDRSKIVCVNLKDGAIRWKASLKDVDAPDEWKAKAAESSRKRP